MERCRLPEGCWPSEAMRLGCLVPTCFRALFWSVLVSSEGQTDELRCEVEDERMGLFDEDHST